MSGETIDVLVADDHPVVVEGLRRHLAHLPDLDFAGSAGTIDEVRALLTHTHVDVLVLDVQMPGVTGRDVVKELVDTGLRVVLFTLRPEDAMVANLLAGGASAFVSKSKALTELVEAIRAVHGGADFISPGLRCMRDAVDAPPPHALLTEREYAVFQHLARCLTPKEAAFELGVSPSTLYTHTERVRAKLGVGTLAEVVQYARDWGLTDSDS